MDPKKHARRDVLELQRPVHGGLGWRYEGVEDFSSNLNPYGPPEGLKQYIAEASNDLVHYPDDSSEEFLAAVCEHHGVGLENVIAGAGSAELIRLFPETFLEHGDKVLMPRPTFSEYAFGCRLQGATVKEVPLDEKKDLRIDLERMREELKGSKAVYICNPNNPTGNLLPKKAILEFIKDCEKAEVLVFLDETLLGLVKGAPELSCVEESTSFTNLFIIRSLTKCFAMPGMRIGYGIGSREMIGLMSKARLSWNLGKVEQHVGAMLVSECQGHVQKAAEMMAEEGPRMAREIMRTGIVNVRSPDSFFFFSRCNHSSGADVQSQMLSHKVLVRDCSSFGTPFDRYVRFAVKAPEKNDKLISAFRLLAEEREQ